MDQGTVTVERRGKIAVATINRPARLNAMNEDLWRQLAAVAEELQGAPPRALVVTGSGNDFCAGFDVNPDNPQVARLVTAVQAHDPGPVAPLIAQIRGTIDRLTGLPVPVIAAVQGRAYGGGAELAARCDLRVLDPRARISFSEVRLGLMPDWGGGVALTRLLGPGRAADLILTGRVVEAAEALALGLANRITAEGQCLAEAIALAESIAAMGPQAVRQALRVIRRTPDLPFTEALDFESRCAVELIAGGECITGITAFMTRSTPDFPDPPA